MTRRRTHPPPTPLPRATTPCPAAACAQDSTSRSSCEPDPASSPELHLLPRLPSANRTPPSGFSGTAVSSGPTSSPEAVHRCSASFRPCNGLPCTALAEAGILEEYFQPGRALSTVQEDNNDSQYDGCCSKNRMHKFIFCMLFSTSTSQSTRPNICRHGTAPPPPGEGPPPSWRRAQPR
ncbi:uncharacterized protein [Triticum aestivum]|uniref:uncharacterized protein isoform X2 n=1 Tax=Triticum aestivum TaxID=4565 RepID=UPI001D0211C1|nr:uncharacterized protein LOC123092426 isoform X2 [Triticum aestivum]XP_044370136.1 uncharacterized protein LOC123092426 isoform X2 [Triticum aestivum]